MNKFQLAREAYEYDPATGEFYWKVRPREHFKNQNAWTRFNRHTAGKPVCLVYDKEGYRLLRMTYHSAENPRLEFKAHRVAWFLHYGEMPEGQLDHINRDEADNRIANLRLATPSENQRNKRLHRRNTSGATGISFRECIGKWRAEIRIERKRLHLGCFDSLEAAIAARRQAEAESGFLSLEAFSDR